MRTTLAEWDAWIRPHLHGIATGAEICARHVKHLVHKPAFETLAFAALEETERELVAALEKVRAVKRSYRELPPGD